MQSLNRMISSAVRFGPRLSPTIVGWLWGFIGLLVAMIMLGGATRLTRSGLSITEWKPFLGIIPPLSDTAWLSEFNLYKATPEFKLVNSDMSLEDFKFIFWMEFSHRLLGRFIALYLLVPMIIFWWQKNLPSYLKSGIIWLIILIGLQGALGWYMVASGLVHDPHVSHYRLAAHLLMAFLIIALAISLVYPRHHVRIVQVRAPKWALWNVILVAITVFYGAMVAGLKAGLIYNTFPLMEGQLIPSEWLHLTPWWMNFLENHATVQWVHRMLAYSVFLSACIGFSQKWISFSYIVIVLTQLTLGVLTLVYAVPVSMGTLHQGWASIVFISAFWIYQSHKHSETALYTSSY